MKKDPVKRYSQALKQQVVREYEAGASVKSLRNKYGIGGHQTVLNWIKRYGRSGYRSEVVMLQSVEDQLGVKAMQERIAELESALAESVLDNRMLKATIDVADRELEMDLKKTFGNKS
ncbi:MAG: transposase [Pseudomonadota bacterium]